MMSRYFSHIFTVTIAGLFFLQGCGEESSLLETEGKSISRICTEWDASSDAVNKKMTGEDKVFSDESMLIYSCGRGIDVMYQFLDGKLQLSAIIVRDGTDFNFDRFLSGYDRLGYFSSAEVYSNEKANTVAFIYEDDGYNVLGFQPIVSSSMANTTGDIRGHAWVDLGLPSGLLWATRNVGSNSDSGYGEYYAWGELQTKNANDFDMYTYKYASGSTMINIGSNISGSTKYDTATYQWGLPWRMPVKEDVQELIDNCTYVWKEVNGVAGMEVKGPNGNKIFLPASASAGSSSRSYGCYWTGNVCDSIHACYLYFQQNLGMMLKENTEITNPSGVRYYGYTIRPVATK